MGDIHLHFGEKLLNIVKRTQVFFVGEERGAVIMFNHFLV